jgi:hypothetical protein
LAKIGPVLSGVRGEREHADAGRDVSPCAHLAAQLEEGLLELLDLLSVLLCRLLLLFQR